MCGGLNIVYGIKEIEYENTGTEPDPNVTFSIYELEKQEAPLVDDLILNIDGCFYKVDAVDGEDIATTRVTLQGSGTGGGGGTGGSGGGSVSYSISAVGGTSKIFSTTADEMLIGFKASYKGDDLDNHIAYVSCTISGEEYPFLELADVVIPFNKDKYIDLAPYASLFSTIAQKTVKLEVKDIYNETRSMNYKIKLVEMSIEQTNAQPDILYSLSNKYTYDCNVYGGLTLSNRRVVYTFCTEKNPDIEVKSITYNTTIEGNVKKELDLSGLQHGTYVLKVQAFGDIAGTTTIVPSNIITHKILCFDTSNGSAIFSVFTPEKTEQFATIPISALLVTGGSSKEYSVEVKIDGKLETTLKITAHTPLTYNLMFENKGTYSLVLTVVELNMSYSELLTITEYTGKLPVIDTNRDDLELYLNPRGKSNDSTDRNVWNNFNGNFSASLQDFYYGTINGWFTDETGTPYLKFSQGAKLELPDYKPFATNAMDASKYGITIELDFKLNSILDYDKDLIRCVSTDKDGVIYAGFKVTGNKAYLYTSVKNGITGDPVTLNMVENQRIKITYVIEKNDVDFPMVLTYLNGIISSVSKYEKTDRFVDAGGDGAIPGTLYIDSQYGQIDIYGIRIYSAALEQSVVLGNYQASLGSLEEREANFKSNSILTNNKVDLRYMEDEGYELGIPYIKITGGYKAADKKAMTMGVSGDEFALPVGKKDFRLISFELKYPKTGYFAEKGYEDFKEMCTFASGKNETSENPAYGETPETGAVMYAQGTSSLEYPVKNLRVQFKTKKVSVRPGMEPVKLICLKADFMESSGSHNTGAANFVDDVYKMANMSTPGQDYYEGEDIVTAIKGHPVAVFWSPSGKDGTYEYIGKYNFNLDKATPEPFGFKNTPEEYDASATEKFGWDANGENTIRCFEYLDNSIRVCNFLPKTGKTYQETWYELITDTTGKTHYGWTEGFESRHPEDIVDEHGADCLYTMASWVNELYNLRQTDEAQAIARFRNEYQCYFNKDYLLGYYLITNMLLMIDSRTKNCMMASWGPEPDNFLGNKDFKEQFYYPLKKTESGTWVPDTEAEPVKPGAYIWYPIFYDMDTMLGIDNQGYPRLNYYDEDTNPETFNGNDVLWELVRDSLPGEIAEYYGKFESASAMFTASTILPYFNNNQANLANEALYNGDAEYKYIDTFREGYYDHLNTDAQGNPTFIEPGKGTRLYAAQGDRSLDRQYFVTNRVNFLRGKYQSSNYQSGDRIEFRCYNPDGKGQINANERERIEKSKKEVPFSAAFNLTALGPGFAGVRIGQNGTIHNHQFTTVNRVVTIEPDQDPDDTEAYILGLNNLSDVGDLSNKYMGGFELKYPNKLKRIILGNDNKDYYNPYWRLKKSIIDVQACYLLEELNMYNCDGYRENINVSACKQLRKLYLTGCGVTTLTLPEGTVIEEMRLPDTLQTLIIKNQNFLTKDNFSMGHYNYGTDLTNITDKTRFVNTYNNLRYVQILNTPINSYEIATKATNLQEYQFTNVNWLADENDAQYCSLNEADFKAGTQYYKYISVYTEYDATSFEAGLYEKVGETYQLVHEGDFKDSVQYYKRTSSYEPYTPTAYESGLYELIPLINPDGTITRIPVLERLMRLGTTNSVDPSEALTGTLTIDLLCDDGSKPSVNEFDIYYRYNAIYPNLTILYGNNITGQKAFTVEFYRTDVDNMSDSVTPDYVVQTNGNFSLAYLTGENSPAGEVLFLPAKASNDEFDYDFSGYWVNWDTKEEYAQANFEDIIPKGNMKLVPRFIPRTRYYPITFYDYAGEPYKTVNYTFNQTMSSNPETVLYLTRPDTGLSDPDNFRYTFIGWINKKDFTNETVNPTFIDLTQVRVNQGSITELYPYYEEEDCRTVSSNLDYFEFREVSVTVSQEKFIYENDPTTEAQYTNLGTLYAIKLKDEYNGMLSGKITLPSKDANGRPVTAVLKMGDVQFNDDFSIAKEPLFTHVFFMADNKYQVIMDNAFGNNSHLTVVNFPENNATMKYILDNAFVNNNNLTNIINLPKSIVHIGNSAFMNCNNINFPALPESLTYIGASGFYGCYSLAVDRLPQNMTQLLPQVFYNCQKVTINHFGNSTNGPIAALDNCVTHIGSDAFSSWSTTAVKPTEIYLHNTIVYMGGQCFNNYGVRDGLIIYDGTDFINEDTIIADYFGVKDNYTILDENDAG